MRRGLSVLKYPVSSLRCLSRAGGETLIHMYSTVLHPYSRSLPRNTSPSLPPFSLTKPRFELPRNQITIRYRDLVSHNPCPRSKTEGKNPDSSPPPAHDAPRIFPKFRESGVGVNVSVGLIQLAG
jgi:hypothetical protein